MQLITDVSQTFLSGKIYRQLRQECLCYGTFFTLFVLCFGTTLPAQTKTLDQTVKLKIKEGTTLDVLHQIEKQANVNFIYNPNDLALNKLFTFRKKERTIKMVLSQVFEKSPITYKADGNQIILYKTQSKKINYRVNKPPQKTKNLVLSGYLLDATSGEAMIAASIYEQTSFVATTTNNFGFFSLTLPPGAHTIVVSFIGYETQEIKVKETKQITIKLQPTTNELTEVVVSATKAKVEAEDPVKSAQIGVMRISANKLKSIPALAGEADVLKAITLLPGIKPGVEGAAGFYVRGGGPDQNLILLDGVPMYNPYHLFGLLSTFNPDAINNIEVTKGAFPARYGGRLSSVLDIITKDGNNQKWEKKISLGLLSAKASINGPLIKDKSSISISARRTLLDLLIAPIAAERERGFKRVTTYNFGDVNLKYNYKISNKDKLYVSGFYSRDALKIREKTKDEGSAIQKLRNREGWQNGFGSFRWNHLFNDKLFLNTTAYYSNYNYFTTERKEVESQDETLVSNVLQEEEYRSKINDIAIKQDYHYYLNQQHNIRFGGSVIFHNFKPGVSTLYQKTGEETIRGAFQNNTTKAKEFGLYIEDNIAFGKRLKLNLGVHASALSVQEKFYKSIQPRASFNLLLADNFSLKGGYAQMTQYLHLLTSSELTKSTDLWVSATKNTLPANATQFSFGTAFNLGKYGIELEGYYKEMTQLIDYKNGNEFLVNNDNWENKVGRGEGESYGVELFIQKKKGLLTGWLGYTISWTNRTFDFLNGGKSFPYTYDRRHDISLVGNYQWNDKWSFNGTWVFYSGNYATIPTLNHINPNFQFDDKYAWLQFPNEESAVFAIDLKNPGINDVSDKRNNYKLPDYHRLDLSATMKIVTKKGREAEWTFGLTNAYNKFNPWRFSDVARDNDNDGNGSKITAQSAFPIMPTVSYSITL